jgi:hypothetical protein
MWFHRSGRVQLKAEGAVMGVTTGLFGIALILLLDWIPKQKNPAVVRLGSYVAIATMAAICWFVHSMFLIKHPYYPM